MRRNSLPDHDPVRPPFIARATKTGGISRRAHSHGQLPVQRHPRIEVAQPLRGGERTVGNGLTTPNDSRCTAGTQRFLTYISHPRYCVTAKAWS